MSIYTRRTLPGFLALAALLFVVVFAACDSNSSATDEEALASTNLTELAAGLATDLNLTPDQTRQVNDLFANDKQREPGYLWTVAAQLQQRLTEEQKARLAAQAEQHPRFDRGRPGMHDGRGAQGPRFGNGRPDGPLTALLTPEQKETLKALHEANRDKVQALMQARKDGSLAPEAFREQMKALHDAMRQQIDALLTDEQKAQLQHDREAMKQRFGSFREEASKARAEALGLTAEQEAALEAMQQKHRDAFKALRDEVRAGDQDREAARTRFEELRATQKAEQATVLTPEQAEIVEIHQALLARLGTGKRGRSGAGGFRSPHGAGPQEQG